MHYYYIISYLPMVAAGFAYLPPNRLFVLIFTLCFSSRPRWMSQDCWWLTCKTVECDWARTERCLGISCWSYPTSKSGSWRSSRSVVCKEHPQAQPFSSPVIGISLCCSLSIQKVILLLHDGVATRSLAFWGLHLWHCRWRTGHGLHPHRNFSVALCFREPEARHSARLSSSGSPMTPIWPVEGW